MGASAAYQGNAALRRVRGLFSPVSTNNFISD